VARVCACCQHPKRGELDAALLAESQPLKDLALSYGISAYSLSRHKAKHLLAPLTDTSVSESEQLQLWAARADEMYLLAGANADVRSQCQALAAGLRALEFSLKRREELQAQASRELPSDPCSWSEADRTRVIAIFDDIIRNTSLPTGVIEHFKGAEHEQHFELPLRLSN
jgi:hypothetical protein